jgi:hypothetical protein
MNENLIDRSLIYVKTRNLLGDTEANHENPQSVQLVSGKIFELRPPEYVAKIQCTLPCSRVFFNLGLCVGLHG